jgi:predicted membrane channel-forming protein YqfA (hemolysin III family)
MRLFIKCFRWVWLITFCLMAWIPLIIFSALIAIAELDPEEFLNTIDRAL